MRQDTKAIAACRHIVDRVRNDSDFAWYMIHTEGLRKCLEAIAHQDQQSVVKLQQSVMQDAQNAMRENIPRVKQLEQQVTEAPTGPTEPPSGILKGVARLEELLHYCNLRGEQPTVESIRAAMSGRSFSTCLAHQ